MGIAETCRKQQYVARGPEEQRLSPSVASGTAADATHSTPVLGAAAQLTYT